MLLRPMLVTSGKLQPDSDRYSYEVKWDGFRALVEVSPKGVEIMSRNGHDMSSRYPQLQGLAGAVAGQVVLDASPVGGLRHASLVALPEL